MIGCFKNLGATIFISEDTTKHLLFENYDVQCLGKKLLSGDVDLDQLLKRVRCSDDSETIKEYF